MYANVAKLSHSAICAYSSSKIQFLLSGITSNCTGEDVIIDFRWAYFQTRLTYNSLPDSLSLLNNFIFWDEFFLKVSALKYCFKKRISK